jgi:hypothetical protein
MEVMNEVNGLHTKGLRIEFLDQHAHVVIMPPDAGGVCGVWRVQQIGIS